MGRNFKKAVHLTTVHHPLDTRIYHKQCKTLADNGYQVTLIARCHEDLKKADLDISVKVITLSPVKNRFFRMTRSVFEAYTIAKKLDADIYHLHDPELIPIGLLLKKKGKKVIYDIHEDYPERIMVKYWIPKVFRTAAAGIYAKIEALGAKFFDALVCTEKDVQKRLGEKAVVIENAPLVHSSIVDLAYKYSKKINKGHCYRVVFIGGLSEARGLFNMVKAVEQVNKSFYCRLWLGGTCPDKDEWEKAQSLPGWKYVDYLGRLTQSEAYSYVLNSDVGLIIYLPVGGHEKANPNKIYEYQRFGIPFIASDFKLWKDRLNGIGSGIFVDPVNIEAIAEAVIFLKNNYEEAKKMGYNGQGFILNNYNWDLEAKNLLNLYSRIIRER